MRGDSKNERSTLRTSRSLSRASMRLAIEPAQREAMAPAELQQVFRVEREAPLTDTLRCFTRRVFGVAKLLRRSTHATRVLEDMFTA